MKIGKCTLLVALMVASTEASAQYIGPSNSGMVTTAAVARDAKDDTPAVLEGVWARHLIGDTYEFRDPSGTIHVEVDAELFPAGMPVTANARLRLIGEVSREWGERVEVDVDRMEPLP